MPSTNTENVVEDLLTIIRKPKIVQKMTSDAILEKLRCEKEKLVIEREILGMKENPGLACHKMEVPHVREKRPKRPGAMLRSPYNNKIINMRKPVTDMESHISQWLFSGCSEKELIVFRAGADMDLVKPFAESLVPTSHVHVHIVDVWATILNHECRFESDSSIKRIFCFTMLLQKKPDEKREIQTDGQGSVNEGEFKDCQEGQTSCEDKKTEKIRKKL